MKLYHGEKVITGLVIFVLLLISPIVYNVAGGKSTQAPEPKILTPDKDCVESSEYMKRGHMDLLNDWRDRVVRDGERTYTSTNGEQYEMSLTDTCMTCHSNKEDFCDQCHNYLAVDPYCWDCHIAPTENQ